MSSLTLPDQRDRSIKDYALNRLARLYSVVAPGSLITLFLDQIGRARAQLVWRLVVQRPPSGVPNGLQSIFRQ